MAEGEGAGVGSSTISEGDWTEARVSTGIGAKGGIRVVVKFSAIAVVVLVGVLELEPAAGLDGLDGSVTVFENCDVGEGVGEEDAGRERERVGVEGEGEAVDESVGVETVVEAEGDDVVGVRGLCSMTEDSEDVGEREEAVGVGRRLGAGEDVGGNSLGDWTAEGASTPGGSRGVICRRTESKVDLLRRVKPIRESACRTAAPIPFPPSPFSRRFSRLIPRCILGASRASTTALPTLVAKSVASSRLAEFGADRGGIARGGSRAVRKVDWVRVERREKRSGEVGVILSPIEFSRKTISRCRGVLQSSAYANASSSEVCEEKDCGEEQESRGKKRNSVRGAQSQFPRSRRLAAVQLTRRPAVKGESCAQTLPLQKSSLARKSEFWLQELPTANMQPISFDSRSHRSWEEIVRANKSRFHRAPLFHFSQFSKCRSSFPDPAATTAW